VLRSFAWSLSFAAVALPKTALASEIPPAVRAMIDEAIRIDDPVKVETVIGIARSILPASESEIDSIYDNYKQRRERLAAEAAENEQEELRNAGLLEHWKGKAEVGAFMSTGNTSNLGISIAVSTERKGIDWEHQAKARFDYLDDSVSSREQYLLSYRPRFTISGSTFSFGLAQFESDKFQGFQSRLSFAAGLGYRLLSEDAMQLAVEAGPAIRRTNYTTGSTEDHFSGRGSLDFEWQMATAIKLKQDADAYFDPENSTLHSVTALEAGVSDGLVARLSYGVKYETSPPPGAVSTDTSSRFSLIYGF